MSDYSPPRVLDASAIVELFHGHPMLMQLLDLASRAVRARIWFGQHVPCRYQPLPLFHYDEMETIMCSGDFSRHLVVYYSNSLQRLPMFLK